MLRVWTGLLSFSSIPALPSRHNGRAVRKGGVFGGGGGVLVVVVVKPPPSWSVEEKKLHDFLGKNHPPPLSSPASYRGLEYKYAFE